MNLVSYHKSHVAVIGRLFSKNDSYKIRLTTGEEKAVRYKQCRPESFSGLESLCIPAIS